MMSDNDKKDLSASFTMTASAKVSDVNKILEAEGSELRANALDADDTVDITEWVEDKKTLEECVTAHNVTRPMNGVKVTFK